ncbi:nitrite reductase small subunit NirD [Glutamicibacter sp. MNS18]|uniref:nitrite reductase small subunit NirD n=1 Tax=Glutamicibacter sp. MNS18 TaxID=2989817 RepID=UPI0022358444|nr:nitrite reductase small subunit NirD [Glutamicibacter sp. MNS18]MCW4465517.1 nitrite reductase small subunit NirD [Glutamicibacter sp. MNS18]
MSITVLEHTLVPVCGPEDLEIGWGEAAWIDGEQIALFRTGVEEYFAVSHHCPGSEAKVMARGIVGDTTIDGTRVATVACPLHKEVYRLDTGHCLNADTAPLPVHPVVVHEGRICLEGK